jgi:hypothetical protein
MARGDLLCPIDNTILGLPNWILTGNPQPADLDLGSHVHMRFVATFTCSNGHRWRAQTDSALIMERIT